MAKFRRSGSASPACWLWPLAVGLAALAGAAHADESAAAPPGAPVNGLGDLSIDELTEISVTSVSKRPEPIAQAASSVYVITNDDLRRSGAMTIPDALQQAPNLEVMRIDALDYSISARGFSGFEAANKLLVLIDGRSVYTPLFSGVDWDQNHVLLDDVDRIEVISGPGGTLWGTNAVNGVINITSRSAFDTLGSLADVNLGTLDSDVRLRYGVPLGQSAAGRVYFTAFNRGDLKTADGSNANDGWDGMQGGFRLDWAADRDALTLQGDAHDGTITDSLGLPGYVRGGNVLTRWTRRTAAGASFEVQAYYDEFARNARLIHDGLKTYDIQAQSAFSWHDKHQIVVGGGYRITRDDFHTLTEPQLLTPTHRRVDIANLFAQDEYSLTPDLLLTAGLKLETNTYTEVELMPNARLGWRVSDRQFLWAAVSRAVRNPSRIERDFSIPGVVDPGHMGPESVVAYELGYRGRMTDAANASVSLFYNDYDDLRTNDLGPGGVLPGYVGNSMRGRTYGVEAWADYDVRSWWRVSVGGSVLGKHFWLKPGSLDVSQFEAAGVDPDYWWKLRSQMKLSDRVDLDFGLRYYDNVPTSQASGYVGADSYLEGDARLAWRVTDALELSLSGANLLHDQHAEASEARRNEIPRSVLIGLRWMH